MTDVAPVSSRAVGYVRHAVVRGIRVFAGPRDEPRARRASDVFLLVMAAAGLVMAGLLAVPPSSFEQAIINVFNVLPGTLEGLWQLLWGLPVLWVVALLVAALVGRRWAVARDVALAMALAVVVALVTMRVVHGSWPDVWDAFSTSGGPPWIPPLRLAVVSAATAAIRPHLSHTFRRLGGVIVWLAALSAVPLNVTTPLGVVGALCAGLSAAALVRLAFGSSAGRPGLDEIQALLAELGIAADELEPARRQAAGVFVVRCQSPDGPLAVKVYGRDAWDTQLLVRLWRSLWYRGDRHSLSFSRLGQVEHEAFITLFAAKNGVRVQDVMLAGLSTRGDALLGVAATEVAFADLGPAELTDDLLKRAWNEVGLLHVAGVAHGGIDPTRLAVALDGGVALLDLNEATVSPTPDQLTTDLAQVLVTTAVLVGPERALAVALDRRGRAGLAEVVPYVQMAALGEALRDRVRAVDVDLDDLRDAVSVAAGIEPVDLARLRRVTVGTLVRTALLGLAAYLLLSALGGIDLSEIIDELADASWALLVVGLFLAQTPRFAQAVSTMGASPTELPFGPVTALQFAIGFVNLVIPSSAARIAVNVRFFQRQGVAGATAVVIGALDSFSGFLIEMAILLGVVILEPAGVQLTRPERDTGGGSSGGTSWWIIAAVVLVLIGLAAVAVVPKLRHRVTATLRTWAEQGWSVIRTLTVKRVVRLMGGNLMAEVLLALTFAVFCAAFGQPVPIPTLLVINVMTSLFAGLMPVPGGIGVSEAALMAGLSAAGVPSGPAFAIVITYRLATFYLPPIWGAVAYHWLERNRYL